MEGWGWEACHDPELLPAVKAQWQHSTDTGDAFKLTFPLKIADGVFRPFLTRIVPHRGASGKIAFWFGTNTELPEVVAARSA